MTRSRRSSHNQCLYAFPNSALVCLLHAQAAETMVTIPAGEFTMGRTRETSDDKTNMRPMILRDDRPAHKVFLDAFSIDTHEVTHAQYEAFIKATGHRAPYHWLGGKLPEGKGQLPIYNVDWQDASAYCQWSGKRLPTEAEWEKAARGGLEAQDYPHGDKITLADARYNMSDGPGPSRKIQAERLRSFRHGGQRIRVGQRLVRSHVLRNRPA